LQSIQLKEERKKLRLKKTEKPQVEEEEEDKHEDSLPPLEAIEVKDKSLESLSSLTSDVTTKVGSGVQSVKSGVQVIIIRTINSDSLVNIL